MEKYYVLIEGGVFFVDLEGERICSGFFTTLYLEGTFKTKRDILLCIESTLLGLIKNNEMSIYITQSSFYYVNELHLIEEYPISEEKIDGGFTFYRMSALARVKAKLVKNLKNILFVMGILDELKRPLSFSRRVYELD